MRVRSGIWSVKFGKGTTRYRKSEKQRQRRTMRGEREQPPDRTSLLIISSHVADTPFPSCLSDDKGITLLLPRSLSSRCLSFSAHPPFCTYVSLSIVVLSFTMFFLAENILANASSLRGANQWEKFPRWRRVEEPLTTTFCYPMNLCNLDQSCLDNL